MVLVNTLTDLDNYAKRFSQTLKRGDVVILDGSLGVGKTTFVQKLCKYLGIQDLVSSPTYSLLNVYNAAIPFYHFDLFRLENESELEEIGFFESINLNHIVCIEWALKFPSSLPDNSILLKFKYNHDNRIIEESIWSFKE